MHIIVIGAGLAGLTVAIALVKAGHQVEILESAPEITYIGAGIQVSSNSSRILRKLGVDKYIEKYCTEPVDLRMMRWKNGQILVEVPLKEPAENDYKSPYWHIHRADLHRGLLQAAIDFGCKFHLDSRVISIDPDSGSVLTKGDVTYSADLIVASDGLNSMAREVVLGKPGPPVPTGQMAYRVTLPAATLRGIPELEEIITVPRNNHWLGPHGTILSYLLEGQDEPLINFVFTCDVNETDLPPGVDQRMGTAKEVRNSFKGWDPRIETMLGFVKKSLLYTHEPLTSWSHPSYRLVLIGDAAHAMTPYLAQGAAIGIEDAAILGGILSDPRYSCPQTLPAALRLYERLRISRANRVAEASVTSRWFTQMEDGPKQRERDEWLLLHPGIEEGHINIRSDKVWLDELFGYDAYQVLEEALGELPN
ncbi:Salicylate hydroxylase [Mycena sanguinolenta]|uniref:Salicylate hydroxylase n=1 Tax=Mycena sanguinolenta TaxID=230812 RepID=A0A8H7DBQ7_9AGAR|nr:Salicylate hydroxylase [Mycena sanguinolenta]